MKSQLFSVAIFLLTICFCMVASFAETVCDAVIKGEQSIQGVVIYPNGQGYMFVANHVFDFHASSDLRQQGNAHTLFLKSAGVYVEKRFAGLYLNGGNEIYNVYGLFSNTSSHIFFIVRNDDETKQPKGFYYDLVARRAIEVDQASVPKNFPFVYFSDNINSVYLYQIPVYTFQARSMDSLNGVDKTGYFAFNSMDRQMEFHKVDLGGTNTVFDKLFRAMNGKMLLRAGFVHAGQIYLITKENVYVLSQDEMQKDPMPKHVKVPLKQFLQCEMSAIMNPTDWQTVIVCFAAAVLLVIIIILIYFIATDSKKVVPESADKVSSVGQKGSKSAKSSKSSKSATSASRGSQASSGAPAK